MLPLTLVVFLSTVTGTTSIFCLSLHDALPILLMVPVPWVPPMPSTATATLSGSVLLPLPAGWVGGPLSGLMYANAATVSAPAGVMTVIVSMPSPVLMVLPTQSAKAWVSVPMVT